MPKKRKPKPENTTDQASLNSANKKPAEIVAKPNTVVSKNNTIIYTTIDGKTMHISLPDSQ